MIQDAVDISTLINHSNFICMDNIHKSEFSSLGLKRCNVTFSVTTIFHCEILKILVERPFQRFPKTCTGIALVCI